MSGLPPFRRDTDVATLWAHIQEPPPTTGDLAADAVLARALAKQPGDRFATAGELAGELRRALDISSGQIAIPTAAPSRGVNRRLIAAAAVVAAAIAAVIAVILASGGGAKGLTAIPAQSLGVIDPQSGKIVGTIPVGPSPTRAAVGAGAVWVASTGNGTLLRIDPRTHGVVKTIGLGFDPLDLAIAPSGVYLADPGHVSVVRVDTDSNAVSEATPVTRLQTGTAGPAGAPSRIAFGANSIWGDTGFGETRTFRLRLGPNTVSSVDLGSYTPDGLAYAGGSLWTASFSDGVISRIDPARNAVTATVRLGTGTDAPFATAIAAGTNGVWATGFPPQLGAGSYAADYSKAGRLFHIDPKLNGVVASVQVGRQTVGGGSSVPTGHSIAVGDKAVWVANGGDGTLMQIDPARNVVVRTIRVGRGVDGVTVGDGYVWVSRP